MKKILQTITLVIAVIAFSSCDSDMFNIDVNFTYSTDIPIAFSDVDTYTNGDDFSFFDQAELSEYLEKIKDVVINSIEIKIPEYSGSEDCIFDLHIKFDDVVLYEGKSIDVKEMQTNGTSIKISDTTVLNEAAKMLLTNKKGHISGTAVSKQGKVSAEFTAHCDIDVTVIVNPTKTTGISL